MALDLKQIQEEINKPSKRAQITEAIIQQNWIKFHCDTALESVRSLPYARFKAYVESLIPHEKAMITLGLLKFPIPTNMVTDKVFVKLSKIFDGRNPAFNYQFHDTSDRDDWEWYRQDVLGEPNIWATKAWEHFKTEINCVMVVDMPLGGNANELPNPYFYFVPIEDVISYSVDRKSGNMDWIIFRNDGRVIAIDDRYYRSFSVGKNGIDLTSIVENEHTLGYCPSRFFWDESLSLSNPDVKRSPLSKALSMLDGYLFKLLSQKYYDLYGSYPILSGYEEECDYSDDKGHTCHHGHLKNADGTWVLGVDGVSIVECPLCKNKKELSGAGTYIEVPIPKDGQPDLRNPIQMLNADVACLSYNVKEVERLEKEIIDSCVGKDSSILQEASIADKQVDATFESQDTVLNRIKKGFEGAQQFVDETICRLRYGSGFISAKVNYGTEFYTLTPEVLRKRYNDAKTGGASEAELDALRTQLIETEYRHNPTQMQRMIILSDIEPFRHLTKAEVKELFDKRLISEEDYLLKCDFSTFVSRFERENDNILEFGAQIGYKEKIDTIYETMREYAKARIPKEGL